MKVIKGILKLLVAILILVLIVSFGVVTYGTMTRPVEHIESINKYSKEYEIDPLLILSVIKVESNFDNNAHSHMNAVGLMQVVPETAEWVAERTGTEFKEEDLFDADKNIQIGSFYLAYLIDHFQDQDLGIVAYNGGMGNVQNWIDEKIVGKNGIGLENIPIEEAKNYVVKVNKQYEVYTNFYSSRDLENGMEKSPKTWFKNYLNVISTLIDNF